MKIIESNARIMKKNENHGIQNENHNNHESLKIPHRIKNIIKNMKFKTRIMAIMQIYEFLM